MSTRANIIIKDGHNKLFFYRHSDGYPEGALPTLNEFMDWVKEKKIRDNVGQASGWLITIGTKEYEQTLEPGPHDSMMGWKVGAYEPSTGIHGDVDYIYILDLERKVIKVIDTYKIGIDIWSAKDEELSKFESWPTMDYTEILKELRDHLDPMDQLRWRNEHDKNERRRLL